VVDLSHGRLTLKRIWKILEEIPDPEIPVVSMVELGIVRGVEIQGSTVKVTITPTFSGCPALAMMQETIQDKILEAGAEHVEVKISRSPPWSTEWIRPEARQKLQKFGIAPPPQHGGEIELAMLAPAHCPFCGSADTSLKNSFGPTLCKAIFVCNQCRQPFEAMKPL
jgi:ring-1,2-phenylacetyl-CoA epoxidase subunit PaaD